MSEVELKLLLDRQQVPAVLARIDELPSQACTKHASRLLRSIYFDTAARDLRKNGISLRLRRDGKRWLQTVKLNGTIAGGLSKVSEFEGRISDLAVLHADCSDVDQFVELLRPHYDGEIVVGEIGPVIGTHAGRGTIGVAFDVRA